MDHRIEEDIVLGIKSVVLIVHDFRVDDVVENHCLLGDVQQSGPVQGLHQLHTVIKCSLQTLSSSEKCSHCRNINFPEDE